MPTATPEVPEETKEPEQNVDKLPQTGDNLTVLEITLLTIVIAIIALVIYKKTRR